MTLPLPFQVQDSDTQANFDELAQRLLPKDSRGRSVNTASENVSSAAYVTATTPDRVTVVVHTDAQLLVSFKGQATTAGAGTGGVGLFIGSNQPQNDQLSGTAEINLGAGAFTGLVFVSNGNNGGLGSTPGGAGGGSLPAVAHRGFVALDVTPGTYVVELRYKISAGTLAIANRKLWVKVDSYT